MKIIDEYKLDSFATFIDCCEEKMMKATKEAEIRTADDFRNYTLYTAGKSFVTCREIIILCRAGYPDGALALSRNLYEQFVITSYLYDLVVKKKDTKIMEKYYDDYQYQRARNLKFWSEKILMSKEEARKYEDEIKSIKEKYHLKDIKDYWWINETKKQFAILCEYVSESNSEMTILLHRMQLLYKRACLSVHASCMGNMIRIGSDFKGIDVGPWEHGQENALFLASSSMVYIIMTAFIIMGIPYEDEMNTINEFAEYYNDLINNNPAREEECLAE